MKKFFMCFIPAVTLLTGCGKNDDGAEGARAEGEPVTDIVMASDTAVDMAPEDEMIVPKAEAGSLTEEQRMEQDPGYMGDAFYKEKAWEYVSGMENVDTIIDPENPEIRELSVLLESFWQLTEEYDSSGSFFEVTYRTTSDGILGPIVVYMDKTGTIIGMAYRE